MNTSDPGVPLTLPESLGKWLPPFNFRGLVEMHHPVFPVFTLPDWPGILYFIIGMSYNIALLLFAFLPIIFVIKKWKPVTWWKAFLAIFATAFLFFHVVWGIDDALGFLFGSYVGHGDYLTNYDFLLTISPLLTIILALSPFYWVKKIYPSYTWGRFFLALFFSATLLILGILFWWQIFIFGLAAWANFMNG